MHYSTGNSSAAFEINAHKLFLRTTDKQTNDETDITDENNYFFRNEKNNRINGISYVQLLHDYNNASPVLYCYL